MTCTSAIAWKMNHVEQHFHCSFSNTLLITKQSTAHIEYFGLTLVIIAQGGSWPLGGDNRQEELLVRGSYWKTKINCVRLWKPLLSFSCVSFNESRCGEGKCFSYADCEKAHYRRHYIMEEAFLNVNLLLPSLLYMRLHQTGNNVKTAGSTLGGKHENIETLNAPKLNKAQTEKKKNTSG